MAIGSSASEEAVLEEANLFDEQTDALRASDVRCIGTTESRRIDAVRALGYSRLGGGFWDKSGAM
ncbi:hypothetical protein IVB11_01985 [Bradyrhizobium sp. 177]|uniref:hypothetical protein n=1 Tax=Bradyrhizobium sp. 177 TaxID=2782647 RepID=UPI001FFB88D2|nr:hypothetical protein [Bradyrhizobium sp. 177]MCK1547851.1 hypothetical protein [Bradyrhizobium sp. 177]